MSKLRDFLPEIMGVLIALAVLNVWYLSSLAITESVVPKRYDYFLQFAGVLIGGFIGAYSAFQLRRYEEAIAERRRQENALNQALFIFIRQMNAIMGLKGDFDKFKTPFARGLSLPAMKPPDYADLKHDLKELYFLLEKREPQLLMDITIEQERFEQALNAIAIRNDFYVNEVQPALSHHALNGRPLPLAEFEEKLGERLFQGAINGAQSMCELVDSSNESLPKTYKKLRETAVSLFPGARFVAWDQT